MPSALPSALAAFGRDLRGSARTLWRVKAYSAAVVGTLAIGIAAVTAIFTVVSSVLLRPLPFPQPDQLVRIGVGGDASNAVSYLDYRDWTERARSLGSLAAWTEEDFNLVAGGEGARVHGLRISQSFLRTLGLRPLAGRDISPEEDGPGGAPVVLITDSFWRHQLSADPSILGRSIDLGGVMRTVIGVVPDSVSVVRKIDVVLPLALDPARYGRRNEFLNAVARLGSRDSLAAARTELQEIAFAAHRADTPPTEVTVAVERWRDELFGTSKPLLIVLSAIVAFVMILACANVMHLALARGMARKAELFVRASLGARPADLLSLLCAESLLLALAGGACGILLGKWLLVLLLRDGRTVASVGGIDLDYRVLFVSLAISMGAAVFFGLLPAIASSRFNLADALKGYVGLASRGHARLRLFLVATEIVAALLPLICAVQLVQSLRRLLELDPGFKPDGAVSFRTNIEQSLHRSDAAIVGYSDGLLARLRGIPAVRAAGAVSDLPLGGSTTTQSFTIEGTPADPNQLADTLVVTPGYLAAMAIPVRDGRDISDADRADTEPIALVSESFVRRYLPRGAVGQRVRFGRGAAASLRRIVGIAGDVRNESIGSTARPAIYVPFAQSPVNTLNWVVRTKTDPAQAVADLRAAALAQDRTLPPYDIRLLRERVAASLRNERLGTALLVALSALAGLLAISGVAAVVAHGVGERTRELGIRRALGAPVGTLLWLVLRQVVIASALAGAIGALLAALLGRQLSSVLSYVSQGTLANAAACAAALLLVTIGSALVVALRATRIDPQIVLRSN